VRPPQELLDGLSVDAAWERVKQLELEALNLHRLLDNANKTWRSAAGQRTSTRGQISALLDKYQGNAKGNPELASALKGLRAIYDSM
jgi:hypothetical protein